MITIEQAMQLRHGQELHYTGQHDCKRIIGPRGGITENITHVRVSGQCKTWKRTPGKFRIPVKYGLYENAAIEQWNAADFHLAADCPIREV